MHRPLVVALLVALVATPIAAQTVQGRVVARGTHDPRRGAHVALLDDSLHVAGETDADSTLGNFYLDAPRAGRYSLAVYDRFGNPYASAPFQLDSGAVVEREVPCPTLPPMLDSLPVVRHLTAAPPFPPRGVRYPDGERAAGHSGHVRVAFIVNAEGRIVPGSAYVLDATSDAFVRAAMPVEDFARFAPASADGRPARVVTQLTFGFNMAGAPKEPGDVMVTTFLGITTRP